MCKNKYERHSFIILNKGIVNSKTYLHLAFFLQAFLLNKYKKIKSKIKKVINKHGIIFISFSRHT